MLTNLAPLAAFALLVPSPQVASTGGALPGSGLVRGGPVRADVLTFESLPAGTVPSELFGRFGAGPVLVIGTNPDLGSANAAVVFDSSNPTGGDADLGTPNEDFGGPGVGEGGAADGPFPNNRSLGKVLVVGDDLTDANNDGLVDDPGDASGLGTSLLFDFAPVGGARLDALTIVDIESVSAPAEVELLGDSGQVLYSAQLGPVGDNGLSRVSLGQVPGVLMMRITLNGSAAIDNIVFQPFEGNTLLGRIWDDMDQNGLQDPGEPGIPNVVLFLENGSPGPVTSVTTDEAGSYSLTGVAPGSYTLSVQETSLPENAIPSPCDVGNDDTIDSDCSPAFLDLTFVSETIDLDFGFALPPECEGTIGDLVFEDLNGNNIQDAGDVGIPGVTMELYDATTGMLLQTQVTDENGNYMFTGLCEGEYAVGVDNSSLDFDLGPAVCDVGNDSTVDSECGPECVMIFEADTVTGELQDLTIDWGFRDCGDCDGKADALSLLYTGTGPAFVEIVQHNGPTVYADVVENGDILSFFGMDNQDTFGPRIDIFVDGMFKGEIHTSCSLPIFIGLVEGDFEVRAGSSRFGGAFCAEATGG